MFCITPLCSLFTHFLFYFRVFYYFFCFFVFLFFLFIIIIFLAKMLLIKGDLDHAMKCCRSACLILGDLNDVRAMESCSLLIGDCYVLQGRPWPSLTEYAQVLDSARLRSVSFFFFVFFFSFFYSFFLLP